MSTVCYKKSGLQFSRKSFSAATKMLKWNRSHLIIIMIKHVICPRADIPFLKLCMYTMKIMGLSSLSQGID